MIDSTVGKRHYDLFFSVTIKHGGYRRIRCRILSTSTYQKSRYICRHIRPHYYGSCGGPYVESHGYIYSKGPAICMYFSHEPSSYMYMTDECLNETAGLGICLYFEKFYGKLHSLGSNSKMRCVEGTVHISSSFFSLVE